jgi:DNA-binding beta-propeller fold protein YncE
MLYGSGKFTYELVENWAKLPPGIEFGWVTGAATDSAGTVYVFNRSERPVMVFDSDGTYRSTWGAGHFGRPHGIFIATDDTVWASDDQDHIIMQFTRAGQLLKTIGTRGKPGDSGYIPGDDLLKQLDTIKRAGPPFNRPTKLTIAPSGDMYVTDGYGNAAVHHFSADGKLLKTWGGPGTGEGQFRLPHGLAVDKRGNVWVADRENSRVQLFSGDGKFLRQFANLARPADVWIDPQDNVFFGEIDGYVSVWDLDGNQIIRFGEFGSPLRAHGIWGDKRGDLYLGTLYNGTQISKLVKKG